MTSACVWNHLNSSCYMTIIKINSNCRNTYMDENMSRVYFRILTIFSCFFTFCAPCVVVIRLWMNRVIICICISTYCKVRIVSGRLTKISLT